MSAAMGPSKDRWAVVIGAGLAAAGALAEHFAQVVVLERDELSTEAVSRPGTPQARQLHLLLPGGLRALDELFPGFEQDLARAGAVPVRANLDMRYERPDDGPMPQRDFGWLTYAMSRPLVELILRCRFNPIYGQGMSVAAQEACLLRRLLRTRAGRGEPLAELGRAFLAEAQAVIDGPWRMSAIPDFAYPQTRGERPADLKTALEFSAALTRLATRDPTVHKLVLQVQHLLKPHSLLRDPDLVHRVVAEEIAA